MIPELNGKGLGELKHILHKRYNLIVSVKVYGKKNLYTIHMCKCDIKGCIPFYLFAECSCERQGTDVTKCPLDSRCICDRVTGQCPCRRGVAGIRCDLCDDGFWNLSGECQPCKCHTGHSVSNLCDKVTLLKHMCVAV